jgi:hypothetical protein
MGAHPVSHKQEPGKRRDNRKRRKHENDTGEDDAGSAPDKVVVAYLEHSESGKKAPGGYAREKRRNP